MKSFFWTENHFKKQKINLIILGSITSFLLYYCILFYFFIAKTYNDLEVFSFLISSFALLFLIPILILKILMYSGAILRCKKYLNNYLSAICFLLEGKSDTTVELEYLRTYFINTFGMGFMHKSIEIINNNLNNKTSEFRNFDKIIISTEDKVQLLTRLIHVAAADNNFDKTERSKIFEISIKLNISKIFTNKLISKFVPVEETETDFFSFFDFDIPATSNKQDIDSAYEILGIAQNSTAEQIKSAYRKLVKVHHPDKFQGKSIEKQQEAEDMFIKIQQAYELIEENLN